MRTLGIDLGIHKIAISAFERGDYAVYALECPESLSRATQLTMLGQYAYDIAVEHSAEYVWIEDNLVGNNRKYSLNLAHTMGAVLAAFGMDVQEKCLQVDVVNVKAWKKRVLGNGNAGKDQIREYVSEHYPAYAALCGSDQDKFDATCIGLYGIDVVEQSKRLAEPGLVSGAD